MAILLLAAPSAAEANCNVADPTGTPLNVRTEPNRGTILYTLDNGMAVTVGRSAQDKKGRPWVRVDRVGRPTGWVFRDYLACPISGATEAAAPGASKKGACRVRPRLRYYVPTRSHFDVVKVSLLEQWCLKRTMSLIQDG